MSHSISTKLWIILVSISCFTYVWINIATWNASSVVLIKKEKTNIQTIDVIELKNNIGTSTVSVHLFGIAYSILKALNIYTRKSYTKTK